MRKLLYWTITICLFVSCEKENTNKNNKNYYPLNIGNYWIYQHYEVDSLGNSTAMNHTDSLIITRDTSINGKQFYILEGENYPHSTDWGIIDVIRDSSGYIINNEGKIKFSKNNFSDILSTRIECYNEDTLFTLNYKMEKYYEIVSVPAGNFGVLNFKGTLNLYYNYEDSTQVITKYQNTYFSENVGKILCTNNWYTRKYKHYEKRLIRYHINDFSE